MIEEMVAGYLECQLWAGLDYREEGEEPVPYDENYGVEDISESYREYIAAEFESVVECHPLAVRMYLAKRPADYFGHDFYLTREHHGAGFWDRGLGELGEYLTKIAHSYGSADMLYEDANGELTN